MYSYYLSNIQFHIPTENETVFAYVERMMQDEELKKQCTNDKDRLHYFVAKYSAYQHSKYPKVKPLESDVVYLNEHGNAD